MFNRFGSIPSIFFIGRIIEVPGNGVDTSTFVSILDPSEHLFKIDRVDIKIQKAKFRKIPSMDCGI